MGWVSDQGSDAWSTCPAFHRLYVTFSLQEPRWQRKAVHLTGEEIQALRD